MAIDDASTSFTAAAMRWSFRGFTEDDTLEDERVSAEILRLLVLRHFLYELIDRVAQSESALAAAG